MCLGIVSRFQIESLPSVSNGMCLVAYVCRDFGIQFSVLCCVIRDRYSCHFESKEEV